MTAICVKRSVELERVRAFYELTGYGGGIQPGDLVVGALCGDDVIGVVRIANEHGVLVARGMRVLANYQRQGIGARILEELRSILEGKECFGIAHAHLEDFYGRIGFRRIDEQEAPAFLRERIERYRKEHAELAFILIKKSC